MTSSPILRPYQPPDRAAVFQIAGDTAYFGEPIEGYMEDRRIFLDAFYAYYTDLEPCSCWVVENEGQVIGFLTGCLDTHRHDRLLGRVILPRLVGNVLRGRYVFGPLTWRYIRALVGAAARREFAQVDLERYPAHLHINIQVGWRGYGLGRQLLETFFKQLHEAGIPGVHLTTTSLNVTACRLYQKVGFELLDARPTQAWQWLISGDVNNLAYGRRIRSG